VFPSSEVVVKRRELFDFQTRDGAASFAAQIPVDGFNNFTHVLAHPVWRWPLHAVLTASYPVPQRREVASHLKSQRCSFEFIGGVGLCDAHDDALDVSSKRWRFSLLPSGVNAAFSLAWYRAIKAAVQPALQ